MLEEQSENSRKTIQTKQQPTHLLALVRIVTVSEGGESNESERDLSC